MSEQPEGVNPLEARSGVRQRNAMVRSIVKATKLPKGSMTIEAQDPARALRILEKLANAVPVRQIMREEGTTIDTVMRMRRTHARTIEQRKELVANDAMDIMEGARLLQIEKFRELFEDPEALKKVNLRDIAQSYGIYADKAFQAMEGNKLVVEHKVDAVSIDDAMKAIEEARKRVNQDSRTIDITPTEEGQP